MRLMLWAHPRSRSTAFERAFLERGDCTVLHEPFSAVRYHAADPAPLRTAVSSPTLALTSPLLAAVRHTPSTSAHLVVKDMPSHTKYPPSYLSSFTHHVLLVRAPAAAVRSFHAVDPDFLAADAGYAEMLSVGRALAAAHAPVLVVEADDFAAAPEATLRRVCAFLSIDYAPAMVDWEARRAIPAWQMWTEFHTDALSATTIAAPKTERAQLPQNRIDLVAKLEPIYRQILALRDDKEPAVSPAVISLVDPVAAADPTEQCTQPDKAAMPTEMEMRAPPMVDTAQL